MAYALRYYKEFTHADGKVVRLEIHKKDSTTGAIEIGAVVQGLSLQIQGQQGDIDAPIVKTSLSMTFVDAHDVENGQKTGFWEEFYTPDSVLWKVIVKAKDAQGTGFRTIWGGYVTPDSFSENLGYRGSVNIIARDNIGHMQDFPFDAEGDADGMISLLDIVRTAWAKIESPMDLIWDGGHWMETDGVLAYNTLMNVSAFEGMNWYEAVEKALYSYGGVMRYIGGNEVLVTTLRYLPTYGHDIDRLPRVEPVFVTGATRELVPAVKRIEESVQYELGEVIATQVKSEDFTGSVKSIPLQTSSGTHFYLESWTIKNEEEGESWVNNEFDAPYFNPDAYDTSVLTANDSHDGNFMWFAFSQYLTGDNRFAHYSRRMIAEAVTMRLVFGPVYRLVDGVLTPLGSARADYAMIAVEVVKDGLSSYLQSDGSWGSNLALLTYKGEQIVNGELVIDLPTNDYDDSIILNIRIYEAGYYSWAMDTYVPMYDLSFTANNVVMESNTINTVYNADNNIILSRNPKFGPSYDRVAMPGFLKNGIFVRKDNGIYLTKEWSWGGGTPQQMAVYNHLQLLAYYAKPNNLIIGTIVNADITRLACIYDWHRTEHLLISGNINLLRGHIEGAVLREFARYEYLWADVEGAGFPDTEQDSRTNVEGGASSSGNTSTYNNTTTVNIGTGGGSGGTGASQLNDLADVDTTGVVAQSVLYYNGTAWVDMNLATLLNPYAKVLDLTALASRVGANETAIAGKADKATTLAGYGITDAYTKAQIDGKITTINTALDNRYTKAETDNLLAKYLLLTAANQTIKGNIRIEGNLVVTGDTASGGTGGGASASGVTGIEVNGETYYAEDGIVTLPDYPTSLTWNAISGKPAFGALSLKDSLTWGEVTGKPNFATVATSGSYNDLSNKPTIPTVPTKLSQFTNDLGLATVATSGKYSDLSGLPTIPTVPTKVSAFTNDSGYITSSAIPTSLKNPYSLTFGSKTYDGSAEKTITASDLGALTEHQSLAGYATEANTPYAGTGNTTDLQAYLKANRSFIGSVISNSVWQNILSIRHRNGADDGNAYGMYFRAALTTIGSLVWNKEMNGTWQGERTILDTTNYTDYTYSKASVDSYLAGKQDVISDLAAIRSGAALGATALQSHQSVTNTGNTLSFGSAVIIGSVGGTNLTAALPSVASVKSTLGLGSLAFLNSLGKADVGLGNVENTALSTWAGTSKITTLGTITSGTWNGSKIANTYLANSAITIAGTSVSLGGSITAATITAAQIGSGNTLLHSGNIGSYNAGSATKLQTARTIWGQSFDGTGNVSGALSGVTNINGAITINSSSNVGIGTTSPAYKLDVNGTARVSGATTLSSTLTAHNHLILYQSDDAYRMTFNEQDNIGRIYNITADGNAYGDMYIGSNLANAIVVKGGSYVGVGMVPSGDYKLEVYGAVKSTSVTTSLVRSSGGLDIVAHNSSAGSRLWLTTGTFRPWGDDNGKIDLGASSIRWKGLYCGTGDFSGAVTMSSTLSVSDSATLGGGELTIGNANSCIIKLARGGACYIWATTAGGYYSFGVQDKGSTTIANASLSIYANVLTPGARNKEVDLGSKNCRWNNVYAHGGNFSGEMTVGGILTVGGTSTFNGDVRINGNLVVTGDTASGGTGTISAGGYGPVEIDTNTLMYGGLDGKSDIPQSTMDALGLTQDVVENLINGLYTKVVYKGSDDGHVWTYDADTYGTTKYIYLHTGDGAQSRISIQLTYNGSTWSSYFSSI